MAEQLILERHRKVSSIYWHWLVLFTNFLQIIPSKCVPIYDWLITVFLQYK